MLHHFAETVCAACGAQASVHVTSLTSSSWRCRHYCAAHGYEELLEMARIEVHSLQESQRWQSRTGAPHAPGSGAVFSVSSS